MKLLIIAFMVFGSSSAAQFVDIPQTGTSDPFVRPILPEQFGGSVTPQMIPPPTGAPSNAYNNWSGNQGTFGGNNWSGNRGTFGGNNWSGNRGTFGGNNWGGSFGSGGMLQLQKSPAVDPEQRSGQSEAWTVETSSLDAVFFRANFGSGQFSAQLEQVILALRAVTSAEVCGSVLALVWSIPTTTCPEQMSRAQYHDEDNEVLVDVLKKGNLHLEFKVQLFGHASYLFRGGGHGAKYYNRVELRCLYFVDFYGRPFLYIDDKNARGYNSFDTLVDGHVYQMNPLQAEHIDGLNAVKEYVYSAINGLVAKKLAVKL